jgi:hypothetical protein
LTRIAAALLVFCVASTTAAQEDPRLARSREIATALQQALGTRLAAALAEGGALGAVTVCNHEAPEIAARESAAAGAAVGRTSLRVRNPANEPDDDARATLQRFELAWQSDNSSPPESFTMAPDGSARYMRAIPTQPLCVTCHGPAVAPELAAAIALRYPTDRATGFSVGTLRGAFLVDWPASPDRR